MPDAGPSEVFLTLDIGQYGGVLVEGGTDRVRFPGPREWTLRGPPGLPLRLTAAVQTGARFVRFEGLAYSTRRRARASSSAGEASAPTAIGPPCGRS